MFQFSILMLLTACPDSPEETIYGQGDVLVNDACECIPNALPTDDSDSCNCDTLYHWSDDLTECIVDTTSHDFTWAIDTLGGYGSYLNDVAIVDENNIWVVGNIVMDDPDSSFNGTGRKTFNAAHWDGAEWEMIGIYSNTLELHSILYFSKNDIWVTDYCSPLHWDGSEWILYHLQNMGLDICVGTAMWGTSSSNMYFVGLNGSIVHYDGNEFVTMESGTNVDLLDIQGFYEPESRSETTWVSGFTQQNETVILHKNQSGWEKWYSNSYNTYIHYNSQQISGPIISLWSASEHYLWVITYWGLYRVNSHNPASFIRYPDQNAWGGYIYKLCGMAENDLFFAGDRSTVWHFNGVNLYRYTLPGDIKISGMSVSSEQIYLVGSDYLENAYSSTAIIIKGDRTGGD